MAKQRKILLEGKNRAGEIQPIQKTFLHDKSRPTGQGTVEALKIHDPKYQELIEQTFKYLRQGMRSNEIFANLMIEDNSFTEAQFIELLKYTYQYADNALQKDREYLFQLHMDRYEKIYEQCMTMHDSWHRPLDPVKDWNVMLMKFKAALKALKAKEDLLGLHDKSMVLEFKDQQAIVVEQETLRGGANKVGGFDLDLLTNKELEELVQLIGETRTVPIEGIQRVIVKQTKIEINTTTGSRSVNEVTQHTDQVETKDITYEEMPDNVVDSFEDVTYVEPEVVSLDDKNTTDDVPKEYRLKKKVTPDDIKDRLKKQTLEELKKRLKRKE